ncbi:MAG: hypothetical protein AAF078_01815 [Planctomycetota bacterium]
MGQPDEAVVYAMRNLNGDFSLEISRNPIFARLCCVHDGLPVELHFMRPRPLSSLGQAMEEEIYGLMIRDLSYGSITRLDFGRYQIEFWDEESPRQTVVCDEYEVLVDGVSFDN